MTPHFLCLIEVIKASQRSLFLGGWTHTDLRKDDASIISASATGVL